MSNFEISNVGASTMAELEYIGLGCDILNNGTISPNRTINKTKKLFGRQLRFDLSNDRIPLLTSKYVNFNAVVAELEWFCRGSTSNELLKKLGTGIWNAWASSKGELGPVYGAMWRRKPVSLGAVGQTVKVSDLEARYKRTDEIIEVEQESIEAVVELNKNWRELKEKHPREFSAWTDMLGFCASRFILAVSQGNGEISVTTELKSTRADCEDWADNIMTNTLWSEVKTDIFAAAQPSDIYKPWLSFDNFLLDVSSIAYNESRHAGTYRLTSYFHGVKFYSPWTTAFYVPVLQYIAKHFIQTSAPQELQALRPRIVVDQLYDLIETLKTNPFSRRMVVSSWDPSLIPQESADPKDNADMGLQALTPCHHDWQVCVRSVTVADLLKMLPTNYTFLVDPKDTVNTDGDLFDKLFSIVRDARVEQSLEPLQKLTLDLRFSMRSTDVFLGLPFNIASYAVLTRVLAKIVGMNAGEVVYQGSDVHLYENTFMQMQEQLGRDMYNFPILHLSDSIKSIDDLKAENLSLCNYVHSGVIKAPVSF